MIFFELSEHYHSREEFIAVGILYKYPARKKNIYKNEEEGGARKRVDRCRRRRLKFYFYYGNGKQE